MYGHHGHMHLPCTSENKYCSHGNIVDITMYYQNFPVKRFSFMSSYHGYEALPYSLENSYRIKTVCVLCCFRSSDLKNPSRPLRSWCPQNVIGMCYDSGMSSGIRGIQ